MTAGVGRAGVLCAGAMCVDYIRQIDHWPAPEGLATIVGQDREGGASTFNMAVDLRRLGATWPVAVMGLLGADGDGDFIIEACQANGVDTSRVQRTSDVPSSYTEVMSDSQSGKRTFFYCPGTNHALGPEHFDFAGVNAKVVHLGMPGVHRRLDPVGSNGESGWVDVLRRARKAGLMTNVELVSIEPEAIAAVGRPLLPHLDLLVVNDVEIGGLAGVTTVVDGHTQLALVVEATRDVLQRGPFSLVVVHFPQGCVAATRDGRVVMKPSVRVPPEAVKGSNGAGDAFAAGILYGLLEGWGLEEMLTLGHASAAASLRSLSTVGSIPRAEEALSLARGWGWREPLNLA
ncbi:MAG: carbohydrate kinase family protein [Alsobacter sp.]